MSAITPTQHDALTDELYALAAECAALGRAGASDLHQESVTSDQTLTLKNLACAALAATQAYMTAAQPGRPHRGS